MKEDLNAVKEEITELKEEVNNNKPSFAMEILQDMKKSRNQAFTIAVIEGIALAFMIILYIVK